MLRIFASLVAGAALVSGAPIIPEARAQTPAPSKVRYPTEVFAELPPVENPVLSPNGKSLAAKVAIDGKQYFSIISFADGKRRLAALGDYDLNWWRWVNDDWIVLGIGELAPVQGDKWYISRAISLSADATKVKQLSPRDSGQDADDVLWFAGDGSPRILMASQTSIYTSDAGFWPKVDEIDVSTGKRKTVQLGREGVLSWYADGAGTVRMGIGSTLDGRTRRVLYREKGSDGFKTIDKARTHKDALLVPSLFLKDPGKAVIISDDDEGYSALYELDLHSLERGKQLFATKGFDLDGLIRDESGFGYLGYDVMWDKPGVVWTDPEMAAMQTTIAGMIKGGEPRIVSFSRDKKVAIVEVGVANAPGAYFLYNSLDGSMELIGNNNSTIKMGRLHPVRTIRYRARDGLEIAAVLTTPTVDAKNLPLIVMPHGGPFARDAEQWDWWVQFLADRGYAVIQPNYRGSSGYGTAFTEKGQGQWGLAMQDDLDDSIGALAKLGIADPKRVCMVGASYGGYAAMRAGQRNGNLYRCAVSYAGVSDLNRWMREDANALGAGARKDWIKMQAPDLKSVSPVNFPEAFSIPMLLMHGKKDQTVEVGHSRSMAAKLKDAGKDVIYIEQPEGDHHFSRSEDRLQFLKELEAFLATHNPA